MAETKQELQSQTAASPAVDTEGTRNRKIYLPRVDIHENKNAIVLFADMPGVDENSVNITLEKNVLTLKGTPAIEHFKGYNLALAEYDVGDYQRSFSLSDQIDGEKIEASMKNGVLRLTLPKSEPAKAKKINVKAA
jgi:HSP20 family protein